MSEEIGIFGFGPVGAATAALLSARGSAVRIAQRTAPKAMPTGASYVRCDALDADSVRGAVAGLRQVVLAIGFPYVGALWREAWPRAMTNFVEACSASGARLVFVDNLYMYGPQTAPLSETTPLTPYRRQAGGAGRGDAHLDGGERGGRLRVAALRAPDFYGARRGAGASRRDRLRRARATARPRQVIGSPDTPHDFAYVPDCARAVVTLLDAPDDAFGQAWHVPCAPTRTPREILALGAAALGVKPRVSRLPLWALGPLGLFVPVLREMREMRFQWDRPYRVDFSRFAQRFWADATPFEVGAPATALWFRDRSAGRDGARHASPSP